jgi:alpha-mannosidase
MKKYKLVTQRLFVIPLFILIINAENIPMTKKPITEWLMIGPYPSQERSQVLNWPYLPEKDLAPSPDEQIGMYTWKKVAATGILVDLFQVGFPTVNYHAAYAFTYLYAKESGKANLLLGSDDGIAVWLNGKEVWRNDIQRGHTASADKVSILLNKGWNRLLLKISQFEGGWQYSCSVESPMDITCSLINPKPTEWKGPDSYDTDLMLAGLTVFPSEKEGKIALVANVYNMATKIRENIIVDLQNSQGAKTILGKIEQMRPFSFVRETFLMEPYALAQFLTDKQTKLRLRYNDKIVHTAIPDKILIQALSLIAANLYKRDAALVTLAQEIQLGFKIYNMDPAQFSPSAYQGLQAVVSRDKEALLETLQSLTNQSFSSIPDKTNYQAHVVGHAHIDMNWLWVYTETLKSAHDTFRQVIAFMDEFPDFTFIQSQTALYAAIEKMDPGLFGQIKKYIEEGRWEIGGGMRVEGDSNLSSGETLARLFLLGQRYFISRFGKPARVGWLPDNFGHTAQLPQLLKLAGCDYYYFHRCRPYIGTFFWQAPNGSTVLCYANETYNGRIRENLIDEFDRIVPDKQRLLNVCGVGDHGGGPTREDIDMVHMLDQTPRHPSVTFTTAEAFFDAAAKEMTGRPTHKGEMQFVFEGCYTSVSKIKEGNRHCASALYAAELLASIQHMLGHAYPSEELRKAWDIVTFNTFHDILPGSAIHESNQDAIADYKTAFSIAENVRGFSLRGLADAVDIEHTAGQPIVVFNPQPRSRTALVEAEVYSHAAPATASLTSWFDFYGSHYVTATDAGTLPSLLLKDPAGQTIPAQVVWGKNFPPGWRYRVQFIAHDLPPCGYRTFMLYPDEPGTDNSSIAAKEGQFETDHFIVSIDLKTGDIRQIFDKRLNKKLVPEKNALNQLRIYQEAPNNMSAWTIGDIVSVDTVAQVERVTITEAGPVRACIETIKYWGRSKFIQRTYLYRSYPRIDFTIEAHWFEQGTPETGVPLLRAVFPLDIKNPRFSCHVPFATVDRPMNGEEVPAQKWVDISDGKTGVALLNKTKHSHSYQNGELRLTLLRSSYYPDMYPDQGLHRIHYALFPHTGDWKNGVWAEGEDFNVPVMATEPPSFASGKPKVKMPLEYSFITVKPSEIVLTGIKQSEEGKELIFRLAEVEGKEVPTTLLLAKTIKGVRKLDLIERPMKQGNQPTFKDKTVQLTLKPYEIVTLGIII